MPGFQPKEPKSQSQNAAMHAAAEGRGTLGIPKGVAEEYVAGAHGKSMKGKPMHVGQNHTSPMHVHEHRAVGKDGKHIAVRLSSRKPGGDGGPVAIDENEPPTSDATLVMPAEEAANYPVGSMANLHAIPGADEEGGEMGPDAETGPGETFPANPRGGAREKKREAMLKRLHGK